MTHTPGPWIIDLQRDGYPPRNRKILGSSRSYDRPQAVAERVSLDDALLIAQAPAMLEVLRELKNGIEAYATNPDSKELGERKLNAAYDKARAILRAIEEG